MKAVSMPEATQITCIRIPSASEAPKGQYLLLQSCQKLQVADSETPTNTAPQGSAFKSASLRQ